jgi:dinuclear metal center YbgI/SA1388 family protein
VYTVQNIYDFIDNFAPFRNALSYDNVGLSIGSMGQRVDSVLFALDINSAVLAEAIEARDSVIICHHPVIWEPLKRIESSSYVCELIKNNISVIVAHTNLDIAKDGINCGLVAALNLVNQQTLKAEINAPYHTVSVFVPLGHLDAVRAAMGAAGAGVIGNYHSCSFAVEGVGSFVPERQAHPYIGIAGEEVRVPEIKLEMTCKANALDGVIAEMKKNHPYEEPVFNVFENHAVAESFGLGRYGDLELEVAAKEFIQMVANNLALSGFRYLLPPARKIRRVACCGGAGSGLLPRAVEVGADVFLTGDVKHDAWYSAERYGIGLVDAGHFATENIGFLQLKKKLELQYPMITCREAQGNIALESFFVRRPT